MAELTLNEFSNISREILESKLMEEAYKMDISWAISSESEQRLEAARTGQFGADSAIATSTGSARVLG